MRALALSLITLSSASAGGSPGVLQCQNVRLNAPLAPEEEIAGFQVALDGTDRVVFLADVVLDDEFDALTVPQDGSAPPTLFDINRIPGRFLNAFPQIASATERAVIIGDFETLDVDEIFSVTTATGGGPLTKLNSTLVNDGDIRSFSISPDDNTVVYLADQDVDRREELYRVPINGGEVLKLNGPLQTTRSVERDFEITSDSEHVIFRAEEISFVRDLFSAELESGNRVQLNENADNRGTVSEFQVSPDGTTVVYQANQETDNRFELFRVPVAGGTPIKVNGPEVESDVREYAISPDSSLVVYLISRASGNTFVAELWAAPLAGGTPFHLTSAISINSVRGFEFTPDGSLVVFDAEFDSSREIMTVPISGGTVNRISGNPAQIGFASEFAISPDGQRVAYRALGSDGTTSLRTTTIAGAMDRSLTGTSVVNGGIRDFEITPDSLQLVFTGDFLTDGQQELFAVSLTTSGPVRRINRPLPEGAEVRSSGGDDFQQSLDGQRVVYIADQNTAGVKELFSADIRCDNLFADSFEAPPGG